MNITPNLDNTFSSFSKYHPDGRITGIIGNDAVTVKIRGVRVRVRVHVRALCARTLCVSVYT